MTDLSRIHELLPIERLYKDAQNNKNSIIQGRDVDGFFHPSQMGGCTRKLWYAKIMMPPKHRISPSLRNTFDHGHAVHDWQQRELTNMFKDMENMEFYTEVSIRDEKYRGTDFAIQYNISGRADGLIIIHDQQNQHRVVYELKTMADTSWRKLSKPLVKHISQTSIYGECLGASSVIFQYYNKNSDASKYFLTAVEPEPVQAAVAQIHRVYECLDNGTSPTREYSMWECKSCPYYYDCKPELEEQ